MTANDHDAWRASRHRKVTGPTGNLALIETRWGADDPAAALEGRPTTVTASTLERVDLISGLKQRGVRLWDAKSPAIQHFDGIDTYPYEVEQGPTSQILGAPTHPYTRKLLASVPRLPS